jgi:3-hydroxyacyl-[acyl-carrier-protein] dehydratase
MLKENFYTIQELDNNGVAILELNAAHQIFSGHFPGQPVVPGVCLMQMVKEVLEERLQLKTRLKQAANLKFISPVDPRATPELQLNLSYGQSEDGLIKASGSMKSGEIVCFKFQGNFVVA